MTRPQHTLYKNRNDVEVAKSLLRMTKAELIDEILGTYSKEDLIEIGFLVKKEDKRCLEM